MRGKAVAVTGGARGIGLATARALAAEGANVWIGDLDGDLAEREAAAMGARGGGLDVTDRGSFGAFLDSVQQQAGQLDALVNNAGMMPFGSFVDQDDEIVDRTIAVNFTGVLNGMRLALPQMRERGSGHIVNVASLAARVPVPGAAVYSGAKAAVLAMTESVRRELRKTGVRLTVVMPSKVATELVSGAPRVPGVRAIDPDQVAAAIVGALDGPGGTVVVPGHLDPVSRLTGLLPRTIDDALRNVLGDHRLLTDVDEEARAAYDDRLRAPGRRRS